MFFYVFLFFSSETKEWWKKIDAHHRIYKEVKMVLNMCVAKTRFDRNLSFERIKNKRKITISCIVDIVLMDHCEVFILPMELDMHGWLT